MTTSLKWEHSGRSLEACEQHVLGSDQVRPLMLDTFYSGLHLEGMSAGDVRAEHLTSVFHAGPRGIGLDDSRPSLPLSTHCLGLLVLLTVKSGFPPRLPLP